MSFTDHGMPLIVVAALWFGSTGLVLWLDSRSPATFGRSLAWGGVAAIAAALVLGATANSQSPAAVYAAFGAALTIWGWHELSFLTGLVTGPSSRACPPDAWGWRRFRLAAATLIHHEVALALTAAGIAGLTLGQANPIGGWTFLVLFAARLSAKLNLFLGAPDFSVELFPAHLRHLTSYLKKGPVSALFPVSIAGLAAAAGLAAWRAFDPAGGAFAATGFALVAALAALALLEHAFMALPLPDAALWRWALPASERAAAPHPLPASAPGPLNTPR